MRHLLLPALAPVTVLLCLLCTPAGAAHPYTNSEIDNLKQRIAALESATDGTDGEGGDAPPFMLQSLGRHLVFGGALEVEAAYDKTKGEGSSSDLTLSTAELSIETELNAAVAGHLILLYEQTPDDDNLEVDEAVVSLRCPSSLFGLTPALHAGRQYLPFGNFNSFMVTDPFTVDLGETRATAALLKLEGDYLSLSGGVFNGAVDTGDNTLDSFVAAVTVTPVEGVSFGASWLSDLAESDAGLVVDPALYSGTVAGGSLFVSLEFGPLAIEAEGVAALEDFDAALVGLDTSLPPDGIADTELSGKRPKAWNLELALTPMDAVQIAARYEQRRDFADDARRYGGTISWGFFDQTLLALEYLYTHREQGVGNSRTLTAQLAMDF
jgi:hypothetical protein